MEPDPIQTRHTLILTGIKDQANRVKVAQALSDMGGLPLDRVLQRLDTLPWVLTRQAPRVKALRLVQIVERFSGEITADPPLDEPEPQGIPVPPHHEPFDEPHDGRESWAAAPSRPQRHVGSEAPVTTPFPLAAQIGENEEPSATGPELGMLPLEGVLDPAFRIEPSGSWALALVRVPWQVLGGTLRSLAPVFNQACELYKANFWKILGITGVQWLVTAAIVLLGTGAVSLSGLAWGFLSQVPVWVAVIAAVTLIPALIVAAVVLLTLPHVAMVHAVSRIHLGQDILIGQAYRAAVPKLGRYLFAQFLLFLVLTGLMLLCGLAAAVAIGILGVMGAVLAAARPTGGSILVILAIVLTVVVFLAPLAYCIPKLFFVDVAVIIEDCAGAGALKRSWRLLSGRALPKWYTSYYWIFGTMLLLFIPLHWAIQILFQGPGWLLQYLIPSSKWIGTYAAQILGQLGGLVAGDFVVVSLILFYYSIRNRREGFDFMLQAGIADIPSQPNP